MCFKSFTILIISILFISSLSIAKRKGEFSEEKELPPVEFKFFDENVVLSKYFTPDRKIFESGDYIPLSVKLADVIYNYKDNNTKIEAGIFLAYILYRYDMKISSLHVLQSILIHKSNSKFIPLVFKFMVKIIGELNNDYIVSNFFDIIDRSKLSSDNLTAINYYYAKALFKNSKYAKAIKFFDDLSKTHHSGKYYYLSRYYIATIHYLRNHRRKAVPYLDDIFSAKSELPLELTAQARLLAGRIYSDLGRLKDSAANYELVPQDSLTWDQALLEVSWIYLRMGKYKKVVGRTHSLNSPFFLMYYFPDGYILEALGYLKLCRFGRVKYSLDQFKHSYSSYLPALKKFYKSGSYFSLMATKALPSRIVKTLARNKNFRSLHRGMQFLRFEKARTERFLLYANSKRHFYGSAKRFYKYLNGKFEIQKRHHLSALNSYIKSETKALLKKLRRLYLKYEFVHYEMYAQAKTYLQSSLVEANRVIFSEEEKSASSDNRLYIWQFDYEYWKDELPFYEHAGVNLCRKK